MNKINLAGNFCLSLVAILLASNMALAHQGEKHENHSANNKQAGTASASVIAKKKTVWGKNYFPNSTLITKDGEQVEFFDDLIKDKVVAINFIFTSCVDSCPLETARMKNVRQILGDRVGKDIFFYSISIDPRTDTPAVLKAYK